MPLSRSGCQRLPNGVKASPAGRLVFNTPPTLDILLPVAHEVTGFDYSTTDPMVVSRGAGRFDVAGLAARSWEHVGASIYLRRTALNHERPW